MKKIYMFLLGSLACIGANAIELTFYLGNQKLTPGSTVEFNGVTVDDLGSCNEVNMSPRLYLSSNIYSSDISVTAECTSGQTIQMCAGGLCNGGDTVTKENVKIQTNQKLDLEFHYQGEFDYGEAIPVVTTHFTALDVTEPDSKVEFVLVMGEKGASLDVVEVSENLRAVEGGIEYDAAQAQLLSVYTIDGVCCHSATVAGNGTVALAPGLYIYAFGDATGKIFVK